MGRGPGRSDQSLANHQPECPLFSSTVATHRTSYSHTHIEMVPNIILFHIILSVFVFYSEASLASLKSDIALTKL